MNTAHLDNIDASPLERLFDGAEPQTNLLQLAVGERVSEHRHPDQTILFYVIEGEITLCVGEETASLCPGDIAQFDGDQDISPAAEADSQALVILASRNDDVSNSNE